MASKNNPASWDMLFSSIVQTIKTNLKKHCFCEFACTISKWYLLLPVAVSPLCSVPGETVSSCSFCYTSFLASKKLLRCFICQIPVMMRMSVCAMDHQRTRWLVLSLVMRKRSSRYCRRQRRVKSADRSQTVISLWLGGFCTDPLVVLLLLDLFDLVQKLSDSQLQLGEFVLSCNFGVVVGMFSNLNV